MCDAYSELKFWAQNEFGTQNLKKKIAESARVKRMQKWPNMEVLTVAIDRWILGSESGKNGIRRVDLGGGGKYNWEN